MKNSTTTTATATTTTTHIVPSGQVYRELFQAQVQLTSNLAKVREKHHQKQLNEEIRVEEKSVPLVREGRGLRGDGILTSEGLDWINSETNELLKQNPIYLKYQNDQKKLKLSRQKKLAEKQTVVELPDEVVAVTKGSDIETRLEDARRKKHNAELEDMIQEVALVNIKLEPEIRQIGEKLLSDLRMNEIDIDKLIEDIRTEHAIVNGTIGFFDRRKRKLLEHGETRKRMIKFADNDFLKLENKRVENIRLIFSSYADKLFTISYLPRPKIERLLDDEIQQLNQQILANKKCYAELYAKLMTADIEREKNQLKEIEQRLAEWRGYALDLQIKSLNEFVQSLDMLKLGEIQVATAAGVGEEEKLKSLSEIERDQIELNAERVRRLERVRVELRPPEASKSSVYKWFESVKESTQRVKDVNAAYVTRLRVNYEEANQNIIGQIESLLDQLIEQSIIDESESKRVLEQQFLPIWSQKQRQIEEYIFTVDTNFDELNESLDREIYSLFKFVQGIAHIWDTHEAGLLQREHKLQELLHESRREHDIDNQKREEKLDQILDQMRESSSEKDLKRLLGNVSLQLDAIQRGYHTFRDAQLEIVKKYPDMIGEELTRYDTSLRRFFLVDLVDGSSTSLLNAANTGSELGLGDLGSIKQVFTERLSSEAGSKIATVVAATENKNNNKSNSNPSGGNPDEIVESALEARSSGFKPQLIERVNAETYLRNCFVDPNLFVEIRNAVQENFESHLTSWTREGHTRADAIVAAKSEEIDKELELRLHLHEPRMKRAEMDVHNVRATELLIHEERVERHCAGVEEVIENMKKEFERMQQRLVEMGEQNKLEVQNIEMAFNTANKSIKIISLQERLSKQKDKHMEDVKTALRNFRATIDDKLSYLRTSNAKFRCSFNVFSDGGNFSADEIETHKKRLEKMAVLIDSNETHLLKEMEKLEKRHLDEVIKSQAQFQDKFKYNLGDLQFIERIARWLSETQIKIKIDVNESNSRAKQLNDLVNDLAVKVDACLSPNLDKVKVKPSELMPIVNELNQLMYERAAYLKCLVNENSVPVVLRRPSMSDELGGGAPDSGILDSSSFKSSTTHLMQPGVIHQGNLASSISLSQRSNHSISGGQEKSGEKSSHHHLAAAAVTGGANTSSSNRMMRASSSFHHQHHHNQQQAQSQQQTNSNNNTTTNASNNNQNGVKSNPKLGGTDDPALLIIKNILSSNYETSATREAEAAAQAAAEQQAAAAATAGRKDSKKGSKGSRASKLSSSSSKSSLKSYGHMSTSSSKPESLLTVAQVKKIIEERKAKTRDEMYSYYLTFGEHRHTGNDFMSRINNILRESLEGILTNSEVFYRELQVQNRQLIYKNSLKNTYAEFAESMIAKLKSYQSQCEKYRNQCIKEFRDCVHNYENLVARIPLVLVKDVYDTSRHEFDYEVGLARARQLDELKRLEALRVNNESALRPSLGHPNAAGKLTSIDEAERHRQSEHAAQIESYVREVRRRVKVYSEKFLKELGRTNESLLIKLDDLLSLDDVKMHETVPEKLKTSELLKQKMMLTTTTTTTTTMKQDGLPIIVVNTNSDEMVTAETTATSGGMNGIATSSGSSYGGSGVSGGGRWRGVETTYAPATNKQDNDDGDQHHRRHTESSINTLKATMAHRECASAVDQYNQKFKRHVEETLREIESTHGELVAKSAKWCAYWHEAVASIRGLYKEH